MKKFEFNELNISGYSQNYEFEGNNVSGEIFTFPKVKADKEIYFRKEFADGEYKFTPISYWDIPTSEEDKEDGVDYIFVYAEEINSKGEEVLLYDYMNL